MKKTINLGLCFALLAFTLASCGKKSESSSSTGWKYNDQKWGGFEKTDYEGQATGPNLVLIEGGTFTMGLTDQDVTYEWNNMPRRVTVSSFYIDESEVRNIDYQEYLFWTARVYGETYPEVWKRALPDSLVWREELAFNEPMVENYFRSPDYYQYPVVGINWYQANDYCKWRSDRVNEMILIKRGIIDPTTDQKNENNFDTEAYLVGQYEPSVRKNLQIAAQAVSAVFVWKMVSCSQRIASQLKQNGNMLPWVSWATRRLPKTNLSRIVASILGMATQCVIRNATKTKAK